MLVELPVALTRSAVTARPELVEPPVARKRVLSVALVLVPRNLMMMETGRRLIVFVVELVPIVVGALAGSECCTRGRPAEFVIVLLISALSSLLRLAAHGHIETPGSQALLGGRCRIAIVPDAALLLLVLVRSRSA